MTKPTKTAWSRLKAWLERPGNPHNGDVRVWKPVEHYPRWRILAFTDHNDGAAPSVEVCARTRESAAAAVIAALKALGAWEEPK